MHREGRGEPLVLIHGGGGTWRQWEPVIPLLAERHDVLAVSLVGHLRGATQAPGAEVSLDVFVDGVERDMDALGWTTAHVAGTSLGGLVALVLAQRGRARTCTALATIGGWDMGGDVSLRLVARSYRLLLVGAQLMARHPERWSRRPGLRRLLYWHHFAHPERLTPSYTAELIVGAANTRILPALFDWALTHDGPTELDQIACPVQLLFPTKDLVFPRRRHEARLRAVVPHAEVHAIPDAGHGATWDAPEAVASAILAFTARR